MTNTTSFRSSGARIALISAFTGDEDDVFSSLIRGKRAAYDDLRHGVEKSFTDYLLDIAAAKPGRCMQVMLEDGFDILARATGDRVMKSVLWNCRPLIDALLKHPVDVVNKAMGSHGEYDFYAVIVGHGNVDMVKAMIDSGVSPDYVSKKGEKDVPLLHVAINNSRFENANVLLQRGADPHATVNGEDCLALARRKNHHSEFIALLHAAAARQRLKVIGEAARKEGVSSRG